MQRLQSWFDYHTTHECHTDLWLNVTGTCGAVTAWQIRAELSLPLAINVKVCSVVALHSRQDTTEATIPTTPTPLGLSSWVVIYD
jgi:hypothetical protein